MKQVLGGSPALKQVQAGEVTALEAEAWPLVARMLYSTADLRQAVRLFAQQSAGTLKGPLLTACDRLRDEYLTTHGIRLQDRVNLAVDKPDIPAIGLVETKLLAAEKREKVEVLTIIFTYLF